MTTAAEPWRLSSQDCPPNWLARFAELLLRRWPDQARAAAENPLLWELRRDPARILTRAGITPDGWQRDLLRSSSKRTMILASRQCGKSLVAGALALKTALLQPGSLTLLCSPTQRQSAELIRDKVMMLYSRLGRPVAAEGESALRLELANGSRILALPGSEAGIRVFASVAAIFIDEAARAPDALYAALRPMLAVSKGAIVLLSTAYAEQGFFYETWTGAEAWNRVKVMGTECARIGQEFLAEERAALGPRIFAREYECVFCSADDAAFDYDSVKAAVVRGAGEAPLF